MRRGRGACRPRRSSRTRSRRSRSGSGGSTSCRRDRAARAWRRVVARAAGRERGTLGDDVRARLRASRRWRARWSTGCCTSRPRACATLDAEHRHARLALLRELFGLEEAEPAADGARRSPPAPRVTRAPARHARQRAGAGPGPLRRRAAGGAGRARDDHDRRRRRPRARRQVALGRRVGGGAARRRDRPRRALGQGRPGRARRRDRDRRHAAGAASRSTRSSATLREGARVGTSALRRRAQLLAARPDLEVVELRGNVDTRLASARRARSTRSCSPPRGWTASAAAARRRAADRRRLRPRRPARA